MADRFWGRIEIGGPVPLEKVPELVRLCVENRPEELYVEESGHLVMMDPESRYGQFDELEAFLREQGIPYDRESAGYAEYTPERVRFRPGRDPVWVPLDHDGNEMVEAGLIRSLVAEAAERRYGVMTVLERLQALLHDDVPALGPVDARVAEAIRAELRRQLKEVSR